MRTLATAAVALTLTACDPLPPTGIPVNVVQSGHTVESLEEAYDAIFQAMDAYQVDWFMTDRQDCVLKIDIVRTRGGIEPIGVVVHDGPDLAVIRTLPRWDVVAHEVGHVFGLGPHHNPDPDNVMNEVSGTELYPWQAKIVRDNADRFAHCW